MFLFTCLLSSSIRPCSLKVDIFTLGLPCVDLSSLNPTPAPIFPSNGEQCGQTASGFVALKKYVRKHHPKVVLLENSEAKRL